MILQLENLELNVRKWIPSCEINLRNFRKSPCNVRNWDIYADSVFLLIFLCLNFHFLLVFSHSCNSLARKYSRKGKLPSYINSLVNTKKVTLGELFPGDELLYILHLVKYRDLFAFLFSFLFSFSWKPNNLWGCFPRGWEAKLIVSWSEGS